MEREKEFEKILEIKLKGELSKGMSMIPSLIYSYGLDDNSIQDKLALYKDKLRASESKVKSSIRMKYKRTRTPLTETELKELIEASDKYEEVSKIKKRIRKLNEMARLSKLRMESLRNKRDMLINIAHNERTEKKSKIR